MTMVLTSPVFADRGGIPARHTADGADLSPSLAWSGVPAGTRSLCLIVDDPDAPDPAAPRMTWVHWLLYNLEPGLAGLAEGVRPDELAGAGEGLNDWQRPGYNGPAPPRGRHRYFFKLYALDCRLTGLGQPTKAMLEKAMAGHVLATAQLVGTYQRPG